MGRLILNIFIATGLISAPQLLNGQCFNCDYQFPGGSNSTTSNSLVEAVGCAWGGEYSVYNVTEGETYTWTTCGGGAWDTQLTLFTGNSCGTGFLVYNDDACGLQSTITWTATFTGQVNLLITQYDCQWNGSCMTIDWACTTCEGGATGDINACSGNWYDTGGPSGNYPNNQYLITTICPDEVDQCVSLTFSTFGIEDGFDFLTVYDGATIGSPIIGSYSGNQLQGETLEATNTSGCLTFLFESDFNNTFPPYFGWSATISCAECGDPPPSVAQDCIGGSTVCSDATFSGNSEGAGAIVDLNSSNEGCLSGGENQSSWYLFSPATDGNIGFTLSPNSGVDYDFAVWGPFPEGSNSEDMCPPSGPPIRCSYASGFNTFSATGSYNTGIGHNTYSAPQFGSPFVTYSEGAGDNGWVPGLNVTAGQVYVLVIDNWTSNSTPFNLNWNLQNGATLDCTVLPVEMLEFSGQRINSENLLEWQTASESNADYFSIERADNAQSFETIGQVTATGNSNTVRSYSYSDPYTAESVYYRLKQVDFDGAYEYYGPVAIQGGESGIVVNDPFPNPMTDDWINLNISTPTSTEVSVSIQDLTGRILKSEIFPLGRGSQLLRIHLSEFVSGAYQLKVSDDQQNLIHTARIVR